MGWVFFYFFNWFSAAFKEMFLLHQLMLDFCLCWRKTIFSPNSQIYHRQCKSTRTCRSMLHCTLLRTATDGFDTHQMVSYTVIYGHIAGGCITFCGPFSCWIIDRKLSVGCVRFHILPLEWIDVGSSKCFFRAVCFLIVGALAQPASVEMQ